MKITVIPTDGFISIDGVALVFPFSAAPNLHAIQWNGASGAIETTNGKQHVSTDLADVQPYINAYNAEAARLAAIIIAPKPLHEVKAAKLAELQRSRDAAEAADVIVQGKTFSADAKIADKFEKLTSRLRRGKATSLAAIYEANGTPVYPVTTQLLEQIEDAITAQGEAAWNRYGAKVALLIAAQTVDEVAAVTW